MVTQENRPVPKEVRNSDKEAEKYDINLFCEKGSAVIN